MNKAIINFVIYQLNNIRVNMQEPSMKNESVADTKTKQINSINSIKHKDEESMRKKERSNSRSSSEQIAR